MRSNNHLLHQFDRLSRMEGSGAGPGSSSTKQLNKELPESQSMALRNPLEEDGEKLVVPKVKGIESHHHAGRLEDAGIIEGEGRLVNAVCSDGIHDAGSVQCLFGPCFPTIQTKPETRNRNLIKSDIGNKEKGDCGTGHSVVKGEFETQRQPTPQEKPTSTSTPKNVLQVHAGQRRPQYTSTFFGGELDASENGSEKLSGSAYSAEISSFASELTGSTSTVRTVQSNRRRRNSVGSTSSSVSRDGSNATVPNSPTDGGINDRKGSTSRRCSFGSDIDASHLANDIPPTEFGLFGSASDEQELKPQSIAEFYPSFTLLEDFTASRRRNSYSLSALPSSPNRPRSSASCPAVVDCDLPFVFTHDLHWTSREDSEELAGHIHNLNTLLLRDSLRASRELWDAKNRLHQKALRDKQQQQQELHEEDMMATSYNFGAVNVPQSPPQTSSSRWQDQLNGKDIFLSDWTFTNFFIAICRENGLAEPAYTFRSDRRGMSRLSTKKQEFDTNKL